MFRYFFILFVGFFLVGCSGSQEEKFKNMSEFDQVELAKKLYDKEKYTSAVSSFEDLEKRYPYSAFMQDIKYYKALSYYKSEDYVEAIKSLRNFALTYPGDPRAKEVDFLTVDSYWYLILPPDRDQSFTKFYIGNAERYLRANSDNLSNEQKNNIYENIKNARKSLAKKEMIDGKYFVNSKNYAAAVEKYQSVYLNFGETPLVPEALYRLVGCYKNLSVDKQADAVFEVLKLQYPDSKWTEMAEDFLNQ